MIGFLKRILGSNATLVFNSASIVMATGITAGLGFVYWWVAARMFSKEAVGFSSAAISAMQFAGTLAMAGLGTLLIGELPNWKRKGDLIISALAVATVIAFVIGVVVAGVLPLTSEDLMPINANIANATLFVFGVVFTTLTLVLDQIMIGLLRSDIQLRRNAIFSVIKLVALWGAGLLVVGQFDMSIYFTWALGNFVSFAAFLGLVSREDWKLSGINWEFGALRRLSGYATSHHMLNLSLQAPGFIMPVIVTSVISVEANASFFIAWTLTNFVFVGPAALTQVLYAIGAGKPHELANKMRTTLLLATLVGVVASVLAVIFAYPVLGIFGESYAEQGTLVLRVLTFAVFPIVVKVHYVAIRQVTRTVGRAARLVALGAVMEIGFAFVGALYWGAVGLSFAWLLSMVIEALLMAPVVYRHARVDETASAPVQPPPVDNSQVGETSA